MLKWMTVAVAFIVLLVLIEEAAQYLLKRYMLGAENHNDERTKVIKMKIKDFVEKYKKSASH
ncbi:hypothetical protein [Mesobacillus zeae]|uniref:Uncharacterized protein n=1 Tax=Mesobacillus zeae TaxID=1917180 RepID=A0A398BET9_9BACI|nr:hypothetical protein [Mesobacillus zeae]RID88317.1 hypothetical protein D1970_02140 [Mesobacillus zeae]